MEHTMTEDVWDFLPNHPGYPSRADRDELVAAAQADSSKMRRVRIWDFFFPLDSRLILAPLRAEAAWLRAEAAAIRQNFEHGEESLVRKMAYHKEETAKALADWETRLTERRTQWVTGAQKEQERQRNRGARLFLGGLLALLAAFAFVKKFPGGIGEQMLGAAVITAGVGFVYLLVGQRDVDSRVKSSEALAQQKVASYIAWHQRESSKLEQPLAKRRRIAEETAEASEQKALEIERKVETLARQIPEGPSEEQVHAWLLEELDELRGDFLRQSGQEGRLVKARSGNNVFCLRGPAELQPPDKIEPLYLKYDDLRAHLHARRAGMDHDGKNVALYGVWAIEFLFLGEDEFASFHVFYDFISGRKAARRRVHNYNTVSLIETRSQFREIQVVRDGITKPVLVDDVPSLFFALENSERIEVNFPNKEYYTKALPDILPSAEFLEQQRQDAHEAIRILQENVHKARTRPKEGSAGAAAELL